MPVSRATVVTTDKPRVPVWGGAPFSWCGDVDGMGRAAQVCTMTMWSRWLKRNTHPWCTCNFAPFAMQVGRILPCFIKHAVGTQARYKRRNLLFSSCTKRIHDILAWLRARRVGGISGVSFSFFLLPPLLPFITPTTRLAGRRAPVETLGPSKASSFFISTCQPPVFHFHYSSCTPSRVPVRHLGKDHVRRIQAHSQNLGDLLTILVAHQPCIPPRT